MRRRQASQAAESARVMGYTQSVPPAVAIDRASVDSPSLTPTPEVPENVLSKRKTLTISAESSSGSKRHTSKLRR